jgi:hypothetical protein
VHWYDLSKLAEHEIGAEALANIMLVDADRKLTH